MWVMYDMVYVTHGGICDVCVCKSIVLHMYGYSGACFIMVSVASCKV